ncbi:MAG: hypothetical protein V3S39_10805, partial [Thermodesulfobacteriota bacterium]
MSNKNPAKTVYFLGAGASNASDFHLPTMKGFFQARKLKNADYENLSGFIKLLLPGVSPQDVNLEEVITHLALALEGLGASWQPDRTLEMKARRELNQYVVERLSIDEGKKCKLHLKLMEVLSNNDRNSVLTLNYDQVVEHAMADKVPNLYDRSLRFLSDLAIYPTAMISGGIFHTQHPDDVGKGLYLKLHGGIDWFYCP